MQCPLAQRMQHTMSLIVRHMLPLRYVFSMLASRELLSFGSYLQACGCLVLNKMEMSTMDAERLRLFIQ
jgi:hypothetical protein